MNKLTAPAGCDEAEKACGLGDRSVNTEDQSYESLRGRGYCPAGHYPWDYWQARAIKCGVTPELATLGRAVMREAYQHQWNVRLKSLCGWNDRGWCMIKLALRCPQAVQKRWNYLLSSDGGYLEVQS